MKISIGEATLARLAKGEGILFLGAGASRMAVGPNGHTGLSGLALRDKLCDQFLGGQKKDRTLAYVGDLVKSEVGILEMQSFVSALFSDLAPTDAHLRLPKIRWKAIFTTNYDLLIEKAYEQTLGPKQTVGRLICDDDDFTGCISAQNGLPVIKLHGCLTRDRDQTLPLILSSWEYSRFSTNRKRLFNYLKEWGHDHPIVFCGYEIADENIRDILFDLSDGKVSRPRYVFVNPSVSDVDTRMWAGRRVDASSGTFDDLTEYLLSNIGAETVALASAIDTPKGSPLDRFIPSHDRPSDALGQYLTSELRLISKGMPHEAIEPIDFYRGDSASWGWLESNLDIKRSIVDEVVFEWQLFEKSADRTSPARLLLIKGYAGGGKSVALKRAAWKMANESDHPIFFLQPGALLRIELLKELGELLHSRITVVIDDVIPFVSDLRRIVSSAKKGCLEVTFIGAARTNEWNIAGSHLVPHVSSELELMDLTDREIRSLVKKLSDNRALGYLSKFSPDEAYEFLKKALQSQLLVALHQATLGPDLEEIIEREYANIVPRVAQTVYLDICTLHRFRVPVRAGLIARVEGVSFEDFGQQLIKPLEHVVRVTHYQRVADYVYQARHPEIAEIVFRRILHDPEAKCSQLVKIVAGLNVSYATDHDAMLEIIGSRFLADAFPSREMAYRVMNAAETAGLTTDVVDEHRAAFELTHASGDVRKADVFIERAIARSSQRPRKTTLHVKARVLRRLALIDGATQIEVEKYRREAIGILNRLISANRDAHSFGTKAEILLDELAQGLDSSADESAQSSTMISDLIRDIEALLLQARQIFPNNTYLATAASKLATLLQNHPRSLAILEAAFAANPHNVVVAIRLAAQLERSSRIDDGLSVLRKALVHNGSNKDIHFSLARLLAWQNEKSNADAISQHLRKSFHDGDPRIDAQFYFARHQYLYGDRVAARTLFGRLARSERPPQELAEVRGYVRDSRGKKMLYGGSVTAKKDGYCFAYTPDLHEDIFIHRSQFADKHWESLTIGEVVRFRVGFNAKGPVGCRVEAMT